MGLRHCITKGCSSKYARFNKPGIIPGIYCGNCAKIIGGMEDVTRKKCQCKPPLKKKHPNYGYKGKPATRCVVCKLPGMINVNSKKCIVCKNKIPSYAKKGLKKATHCAGCIKKYKLKGYVDVTHKKCKEHKKIARYGYKGQSATHCFLCKKTDMINLRAKYCIVCLKDDEIKIPTRAGYGLIKKKPTHCFKHKTKKMEDVISKKCEKDGCKNMQPKYNKSGETTGKFCFEHKEDSMINVKAYYCQYKNCTIQASYNYLGETLGKYCIDHIEDGMINVVHMKCASEGCLITPTFGYEDPYWILCCSEHKDSDMINLIHVKCPHKMPDGKICNKYAHFNIPESTVGKYCAHHKEDGMVVIGNKMCENNCGSQSKNELYQGYCYKCYVELFPDSPISISYLTKEKNACIYIATKLSKESEDLQKNIITVTYNKIIKGGSSKRRPDFYINQRTHALMAEIDENRHTVYDNEDDLIRLKQLWEDVGKKPMVIIRFNPDSYINKNGIRVLTPWQKTEKGTQLKHDMVDDWKKRLKNLYKQIQYCLLNKPEKMITIIYLYYGADHVKIQTYDEL
jgi:hypothetical protein